MTARKAMITRITGQDGSYLAGLARTIDWYALIRRASVGAAR